MNTREWALIAFTILNQLAVGSFLILTIVRAYALKKKGEDQANLLTDRAYLALIPVVGVAVLVSLLHLGNPINAPHAIANLGSSWLSREILFDLLFAALVLVFGVLQFWKIASSELRNVIAWVTVVVGLVLVFIMASVYMLPTDPSWNSAATPLAFYSTAFLLGSLATGVAFAANYAYVQRGKPDCASDQCDLLRDTTRGISITAIVFLGVELVTLPMYLSSLASGGAAAQSSVQLMVGSFTALFVLRLILGFVGAGILGLFLYRSAVDAGREKVLSYLVYSAFALVLIAEVMNRFLFYATRVRIGI